MPENMKCPFRKNADGEFCDCYGKFCMAYYEYQSVPFSCNCNDKTEEPVMIPVCRRLQPVVPINYTGCTV